MGKEKGKGTEKKKERKGKSSTRKWFSCTYAYDSQKCVWNIRSK